MQVVYLNTNGFCGIGDKHSHYRNNEKIANANQILSADCKMKMKE